MNTFLELKVLFLKLKLYLVLLAEKLGDEIIQNKCFCNYKMN